MLAGVTGSLISQFFAEEILFLTFAGQLGETTRDRAHAALLQWWQRTETTLGPTSSVRSIWDGGVEPLLRILGWDVNAPSTPTDKALRSVAQAPGATLVMFVAAWDEHLDHVWRNLAGKVSIRERWCICANGRQVRLVDTTRVYADCHLEFTLEIVAHDPRSFALFWAVLHARTFDLWPGRLQNRP